MGYPRFLVLVDEERAHYSFRQVLSKHERARRSAVLAEATIHKANAQRVAHA
jgi:hypothetical protein